MISPYTTPARGYPAAGDTVKYNERIGKENGKVALTLARRRSPVGGAPGVKRIGLTAESRVSVNIPRRRKSARSPQACGGSHGDFFKDRGYCAKTLLPIRISLLDILWGRSRQLVSIVMVRSFQVRGSSGTGNAQRPRSTPRTRQTAL